MTTDFIYGIIVPILTPIDEDERIREAKLREQVDFVIDGGVNGILAFGSNGEFYMVEEDEMYRGLQIILDQARGRVPVYMGIGAISTKKCIHIAEMAKCAGANGISVLQPMFIKPTEEELFEHFCAIASAVPDMPVLLYNNPGRTGYTISADLVERLISRMDNICGMKDSSGDMTQTLEFIRKTRSKNFKVFGGKDTLIYAALSHGAVGAVATTANFIPKQVCSVYQDFLEGRLQEALETQFRLAQIRLAMDQASFPVATKDLANLAGRSVGKPYTPNLPSQGEALEHLKQTMQSAFYSME